MAQINFHGLNTPLVNDFSVPQRSSHTGKLWTVQFLPYDDHDMAFVLMQAMGIITRNVYGTPSCDAAFRNLPGPTATDVTSRGGGLSFQQMWDDNMVMISYDPEVNGGGGCGDPPSKNITITRYALQMGRWYTAAVLMHELAHLDGAGEGGHDLGEPAGATDADEVLKPCGLGGGGFPGRG